jgi:amino acid transporter
VEVLISAGMFAYMRATTTVAGQPAGFPLGLWLAIGFPLGTIVSGLAVLILAEIFKAGADLQDDQALTV